PEPAPATRAYFRGVALQAAGDRMAARAALQEAETYPAYQRRALTRLRRPLEPVSSLPAKVRARAATAEQALNYTLARLSARPTRPWVTWTLGAVILAMFLRTVPGGSLDATNLVNMGALLLPQDLAPGAWRVVTAGFLHRGVTHLVLDLLLLLVFGSILERLWGARTLLVCFLCANVGTYSIAAWLATATPDRPELLLGASAGAYGVVGALIAFDAVGYAFERSRVLLRRAGVLTLAILAQMIFDAFTPMVRSSLHWTGAALGALVALPLAFGFWRLQARETLAPSTR
ncbi:MAG TPA: rhomboid family intramembrane serine protease, partial [Polyangiaceae bacterium]|nr:rhomboid family intramembrane serine protease [Polyangiaceae bacterium]